MVLAHNIKEGQRTQDIQIQENVTFESILLADNTLSGLRKAGFYKPSPIQLHGIPLGKCGFDLLLEAKSGTGKTVVFTVIALEKLDLQKGLQVIMLAPTREIAAQICHVIKVIGSDYPGLSVEVVMGGLPMQDDILKFKSKLVHIIVGSPGRLKHLIIGKHIDISAVRLLVLDECDKLLEKSFLTDINTIHSILPKEKQVIMCSATYPEKCKPFISKYVHNAQHICPDSTTILLGITQKITIVKYNYNIVKQTKNRFEELIKIMAAKQFKQCLIFCNYQARVAELHRMLIKEKWPAELLYGQQEQTQRLDAIKTLQEYKCRILISTDLAARGIDASNVDLIVNFEPPFEWQTYLHRIGRAGRYGSYGTAITILSEGKEVTRFKELFSSINLSLNLQNFWTDDEFSNTVQSESLNNFMAHKTEHKPPEDKMTPNQISKKLWDFLTEEKEKDKKVYQTFKELQDSYKMSCSSHNSNVESFTDLTINNKESVEYSHLIVNPLPIKEYLRSIKNEDNIMEETESNNNVDNYTIKTEHSPQCGTSKQEHKESLNNILLQPQNDTDSKSYSNRSSNENHKTIVSQYCEENNLMHKNCDPLQNNVKALLEAGLPTSFGRINNANKYCFTKKKNGKNAYNNEEEISHSKHLDIPGNKIRSISKLQSQNKITPATVVEPKNNTKYTRHSLNKLSLQNNLKENYCNINFQAKQHKNSTNCNYNYEIWFKQLKTHMKYIEHVIYNDEMSKL